MKNQRGISLVIALFLIVVVSLLAAFAVTVGGSQRQSGTVSLMADRALAAARSGAEWAAYHATVNKACPSQTFALDEGALKGFRVIVTCSRLPHTEGATQYYVYDVTSEAQFGTYGSADYAARKIQKRFYDGP